MSVSIDLRENGSVSILDIAGESSVNDGTMLQGVIRRLTLDGRRLFVFNLQGLSHLDSFGLGQLVAAYIAVRDLKGDVKIVNPGQAVKDMLHYTRIDTVMRVFPTEAEAVAELQKLAS